MRSFLSLALLIVVLFAAAPESQARSASLQFMGRPIPVDTVGPPEPPTNPELGWITPEWNANLPKIAHLEGTAMDPVGIDRVEILVNLKKVGEAVFDEGRYVWSYELDTSKLDDGGFNLSALAIDREGRWSRDTIRANAKRVPEVVATTWPPTPRDGTNPFPPLGPDTGDGLWSEEPYETTLPFDPPDGPNIDFHRGNFSGVRVPGLPPLQSGTAADASHVMTWDLPQYSVADQHKILKAYAIERGYTHFVLSIPQARNWNVLDERFIEAAKLAKSYNQFVVVVAMGGDGEDFQRDVKPWLERLRAVGAVDEVVVCWQGDKWYDPYTLVSLTFDVSAYAHSHALKVSQHWINGANAWWNPADDEREPSTCTEWGICDRFSYHQKMGGVVDYQYFQGDVNAPISDFQWGLAKVLQSLTSELLVAAEYDAQAEFDDPQNRTEAMGDLKGYLLLCSRGFGKVMSGGFMNGARMPDGSVVK